MFGERGLEDMKIRWGWAPALLLLAGCSGVPKGLQPVTGFDVQKYLGHWNEIARLDHRFERGLTDVTADYRKLPDGRIGVINRGFDAKKNKWKEAEGVARFQDRPDVGSLEVSFFGPFYGAYNVLVLDPQYRYAMVAGPNRNYLWILARSQHLDPETLAALVERAKGWGFATGKLIYIEHKHTPIMVD
jgi:apolipoprotein D and lipocalin family protein